MGFRLRRDADAEFLNSDIEGMDYENEELWNERLGLPVEDMDDVVRRVIKAENQKR